MKKIFYLLTLSLLILACSKESENNNGDTTLPPETKLTLLASGNFVDSGNHGTTGKAELLKDDTGINYIRFTSFSTTPGPDLRIYIASDKAAKDYVQITNSVKEGSYSLKLSNPIDLSKTKYLLIWCKQFSVLFGSVELK